MIWQHVRGQVPQVEMFRRSVRRGRLAHAYLFVGPDGIGKRLFARTLAQCLFCERHADSDLEACGTCPACKQMRAGTHPDYLTVGRPAGKTLVPIELFVGADERRGREGLCHDIALRPMSAERRIVVIDDAHLMSVEAANTLLKTLEEPPAYAVMILIATSLDAILPTIRSRCQLVRFAPLPPGDVADLLLEQELVTDRAEADAIAGLSEGSLTTAARLIDPNLRALREALYAALASEPFHPVNTAAGMLERLEAIGGDSQAQRENAQWLIRFCQEFLRRAIRSLSGDADRRDAAAIRRFAAWFDSASSEDLDSLLRLFDRCTLAHSQIDQKTAVPLCLDALFDDLGRMLRQPVRP